MYLDDLDPQTRDLVIQMQLEDLRALREAAAAGNRKGKRRLGEVNDAEVALDAYQSELASALQSLADHAMCESIARAVVSDARLLQRSLQEEEQSARDREMAFALSSQGAHRDAKVHVPVVPSSVDGNLVEKFQNLQFLSTDKDGATTSRAESSTWAASRRWPATNGERQQPSKVCVACCDKKYATDVAACPCSHDYCRDCLDSLFKASLTDETLFPPRCCGREIPLQIYRDLVNDAKFMGTFRAKKIEFETPNRTYCHQPACSTFVPPQSIRLNVGTCVRCFGQTCSICKARAHQGSDCPQDTALQETLRLAAEQGWQRCSSCQSVVELHHGCNHITCRCGYQFCYVCGERWKTCGCQQWDEERLVTRANAIVDRNAARMGAQRRANLVERELQNLRANHQCRHRDWRSRGGRHRCEECHDYLPMYIYECTQCRVLACRRCRYNRLQAL
ncbi:hypothetical protein MFIFM68171_03539 [Madurella fahalii]|uniref:RBR-type E3 ubiquitin transferase n=1 Tax=Madurella fahalii TaxID=1157608 RepID=A0ABQ0G6F2_9PEZI